MCNGVFPLLSVEWQRSLTRNCKMWVNIHLLLNIVSSPASKWPRKWSSIFGLAVIRCNVLHLKIAIAFLNLDSIQEIDHFPSNKKLSVLKTTANAICSVDQVQLLLCSQFLKLGRSLLVHHSLRITSTLSALVTWVPGLPGRCDSVSQQHALPTWAASPDLWPTHPEWAGFQSMCQGLAMAWDRIGG